MKIDQEFILSKDISHLELSFPTLLSQLYYYAMKYLSFLYFCLLENCP